jgi:hypothetical protein
MTTYILLIFLIVSQFTKNPVSARQWLCQYEIGVGARVFFLKSDHPLPKNLKKFPHQYLIFANF